MVFRSDTIRRDFKYKSNVTSNTTPKVNPVTSPTQVPTPQTSKHVYGSANRSEEPKRTRYVSNTKKDFDVTTLGSVMDKLPRGVYLSEANAELSTGRPSPVITPDFSESVESSGALDEMVDEKPAAVGGGERVNLMNTLDYGLGGALKATGDAARTVAIAGGGALVDFWNQFGRTRMPDEEKRGPLIDGTWVDDAVAGNDKKVKKEIEADPYDTYLTSGTLGGSSTPANSHYSPNAASATTNNHAFIFGNFQNKEKASGTDFNSGTDLQGRQDAHEQSYSNMPDNAIPDFSTLQPNVPATDNFNVFSTKKDYSVSQIAFTTMKNQYMKNNPDAKGLPTQGGKVLPWDMVASTAYKDVKNLDKLKENKVNISHKNQNAQSHGQIQTSLNQQNLDKQYNNLSNVWSSNFSLQFGTDNQPSREEARDFIDAAQNRIANQDNIGGYNMGAGYQDMYINELETKMTNLYGIAGSTGRPDGAKLTVAEKLQAKVDAGITLKPKEQKKLDTLTNKVDRNPSVSQQSFNVMKSNYLDVNPNATGLPTQGGKTISWNDVASTAYKDVKNKPYNQNKAMDSYDYFA